MVKPLTNTLLTSWRVIYWSLECDGARAYDTRHPKPIRGWLKLDLRRRIRGLGPSVPVAKRTPVNGGDERSARRRLLHSRLCSLALDLRLERGERLERIWRDLGARRGRTEIVCFPLVLQLLRGEGIVFAHRHA